MSDMQTIPEWRLEDRIKRAIEFGNVSKQTWADECGVSIKSVYHWCNGHSRPRRAALKELARLSGVSLEWIEGKEPPVTSSVTLRNPRRVRLSDLVSGTFLHSSALVTV